MKKLRILKHLRLFKLSIPGFLFLLHFAGCFPSPTTKAEDRTCSTDKQCPNGYFCVLGSCAKNKSMDASAKDLLSTLDTRIVADGLQGESIPSALGDAFVGRDLASETLSDMGVPQGTGGTLGKGDAGEIAPISTGGSAPSGGAVNTSGTIVTGGTTGTGGMTITGGTTSSGGGIPVISDAGGGDTVPDTSPNPLDAQCTPTRTKCCTNADCTVLSTPECSAGTCVGGILAITPTSASFGSIPIDQSSSVTTFTVTNTGAGATGTLNAIVAGSSDFAILPGSNCKTGLPPNGKCTIAIEFTPSSRGKKDATLQVSGTPGGLILAALSGTGLGPALLTISPSAVTFPNVITGGNTSASVEVTIRNVGDLATSALTANLSGANASEFSISNNYCSAPLSAEASCTIFLVFRPAARTSGQKNAILKVSANMGGTVSANLTGTAQQCDFDSQCNTGSGGYQYCLNHVCITSGNDGGTDSGGD